jgi:uncharacterized membrane protein
VTRVRRGAFVNASSYASAPEVGRYELQQNAGARGSIAARKRDNCRDPRHHRPVDTLASVSDVSTSPEVAKSSVDRLTFFSDAVVAIAMTLLAIDLPVPNSDSASGLAEFVGGHLSEYLAFLISFFVIAQYWRGHHRAYRYVTDAPSSLVRWNTLWLFTVILTPYATRTLYGGDSISGSDFPWRFTFYALVQFLAALSLFLSLREVMRTRLISPDAPPDFVGLWAVRNAVLMIIFGVSIPLAFVIHAWAFGVWMLIPVGMSLGVRLVERRQAQTSG